MNIANDRLINGLLKGIDGASPDAIKTVLSADVEIHVSADRASFNDLWPAIWSLAAVLERQLFGRIFINCGLTSPLDAPSKLGDRCIFVSSRQPGALLVTLGDCEAQGVIRGDARRNVICVNTVAPLDLALPSPVECFLLAGYLGFNVLAVLMNLPPYHEEFARSRLVLDFNIHDLQRRISQTRGFTCIGLGQIGQAFLALLYFLCDGKFSGSQYALVDDDLFEEENGRTQVLLDNGGWWKDIDKVEFLTSKLVSWGAEVIPRQQKISWGWHKDPAFPKIALLGLDDFEPRRIALAAGFDGLIEGGVGTNLLQPRVSWHVVPGIAELGRRLFPDTKAYVPPPPTGKWADELKATPGNCGWVQFLGISATAPCLGIAVAALALSEFGGPSQSVRGSALLWSTCLPLSREEISTNGIRSL